MTKLLLALPLLFAVACSKPAAVAKSPYEIDVTEQGFEPANLRVPAGKPVTIVFDRKTDATCAKQIVLDLGDGKKIERELPLDTRVEVAATFPKAGTLTYACGMDMMKGTLTVQ